MVVRKEIVCIKEGKQLLGDDSFLGLRDIRNNEVYNIFNIKHAKANFVLNNCKNVCIYSRPSISTYSHVDVLGSISSCSQERNQQMHSIEVS